ncbi:MAG: DUF5317 family protein [Rubrobacteridae bacterium]|nr:DUF5317 family protein [Rubrobacteridae bacterium]
MLAFAFVALAIVIGYVQGGKINKTIHIELKHAYLIWLAFGLQVFMLMVKPVFGDIIAAYTIVGHFAAYILVVTFLLLNWSIRGLQVIAAGLICNLFAIVASSSYAGNPSLTAGSQTITDFSSMVALFKAKPLWFLGDVFSMPGLLKADTFSIGDILVGMGLFLGTRKVLFSWPATTRFQIKNRYQPKHLNNAGEAEFTDIAS